MNMKVYATKTTTDIAPDGKGLELSAAENLDIVIDATAGIGAEEQEEIIANLDAIAGRNRITSAPVRVAAKKRGLMLPVAINAAALVALAGGLFLLWTFYKQNDAIIRTDKGQLNSAEGKLLEEMRTEFDAARAEIDKLNSNLERATLFEWQMSGFYSAVNDYFREGKLAQARDAMESMRDFVNTPSFRDVRQIEERREINLATIDAMSYMIDESMRAGRVTEEMNAAAKIAQDALSDKEAAETRAAALEAELSSAQAASRKTIDALSSQNAQKDQAVAARDSAFAELKSQAASFQQTIASNQQTIGALRSEVSAYKQKIDAVSAAVAPAAPAAAGSGSAALDAARQQAANAQSELDKAFE
ncbi:MAG: hypothetical protein LBS82_02780 [Spirochaetaceae bacterium]|jgi:hypothetical protein|nr:hypothetical protein [Spirochaetaceae bacterium]